jgi:hypothetical protein
MIIYDKFYITVKNFNIVPFALPSRYRFQTSVTLQLPYRYLTVTLPLPYRYLY